MFASPLYIHISIQKLKLKKTILLFSNFWIHAKKLNFSFGKSMLRAAHKTGCRTSMSWVFSLKWDNGIWRKEQWSDKQTSNSDCDICIIFLNFCRTQPRHQQNHQILFKWLWSSEILIFCGYSFESETQISQSFFLLQVTQLQPNPNL